MKIVFWASLFFAALPMTASADKLEKTACEARNKHFVKVVAWQNQNVYKEGGGVVVINSGLVLTVAHIFTNDTITGLASLDKITVGPEFSKNIVATLVTYDLGMDLALLRVKEPLNKKPVKFAYPRSYQVVFAITAMHGGYGIGTFGRIAGQSVPDGWEILPDFKGAMGLSGSPAFNEKGECIGIGRALVPSSSSGDSLPILTGYKTILRFFTEKNILPILNKQLAGRH